MPVSKIKWGGKTTVADVKAATVNQYAPYDGPTPPPGVYAFYAKMTRGKSQSGGKKIDVVNILAPRKGKSDTKFNGCPVWDTVPDVDFRIRALCDALGLTAEEFMDQQSVDTSNGRITKIGKLVVPPEGVLLLADIYMKPAEGEYAAKLAIRGYLPKSNIVLADVEDGEGDGDPDAEPDADAEPEDETEAPF